MKLKGLLIGGAVVAAAYFLTTAYNGFWQRIRFGWGGIRFGGLGADLKSIVLNPALSVRNDNDFTIPVTGFQGYIYFQGQPFVPIRSASNTPIQPNTDTKLEYQLTIGWEHLKKLGDNWKELLSGGNFRLVGNIQVTVSSIIYQFPINEPFALEI